MSRLSGAKAKQNGENFENYIVHKSRAQGIACTRIPDGCKQVGARQLIRVKSPFDFTLSYQGKSAMIDTKSVQGSSLGRSAIDVKQAEALMEHQVQGVKAGYLIWLRKINKVVFVPANVLLTAARNKSFRGLIDYAEDLGSLFTLDLKKLFSTQS